MTRSRLVARTIPTRVGKTHGTGAASDLIARTIPTRVGKTLRAWPSAVLSADHPHTRGENWPCGYSSPRRTDHPHTRGENFIVVYIPPFLPDHPHTRGENERWSENSRAWFGPSPHAWGKLARSRRGIFEQRTIPTRVGKTFISKATKPPSPDHPHTRGENSTAPSMSIGSIGPSPHAWGKLAVGIVGAGKRRTIPTRVGKTILGRKEKRFRPDHPHTRGENDRVSMSYFVRSGPSPHAWGKPLESASGPSPHA